MDSEGESNITDKANSTTMFEILKNRPEFEMEGDPEMDEEMA
jgi:hypothetical protein